MLPRIMQGLTDLTDPSGLTMWATIQFISMVHEGSPSSKAHTLEGNTYALIYAVIAPC